MGRNSEFKRSLERLRRRLYRAPDGKVLGVFKGIAQSLGFCVFWTRVVGVITLVTLADACGAKGMLTTILVGGFFYLMLALAMQPSRPVGTYAGDDADDSADRPPYAPRSSRGQFWKSRPAEAPFQQAPRVPRVDLAQLDRQLDNLDRRIQRMETIVTDRQYDWERRMES